MLQRSTVESNSGRKMNRSVFAVLLVLSSLGILIAFLREPARAVFEQDGFVAPFRRVAAIALLAAVLLLTVAVPFAGGLAGGEPDTKHLSWVSLFAVHGILVVFLGAYFLLSGHRSPAAFLKLTSQKPAADLAAGVVIGSLGWLLTVLAAAVGVALWLAVKSRTGGLPASSGMSPTILWVLAQPLWVRIAIVASAMVVEELFFRSFLQTRVGPVAATLMFTAAHGVYGQPLFLVWVLLISTVMSVTFTRYRNVLPCIAAHGTFDAIQMFVVIPRIVKLMAR
jgi:membrane protease YdiL (CAAX protease family)